MVFGHTHFLVGFKDSPDFYLYTNQSGTFEQRFRKPILEEVKYNCYKDLSPRGDLFLQRYSTEVCVFDDELHLTRTLSSTGSMICLLPGGECALIDNYASPTTQTEGLRLAVVPVTNLHHTLHQLTVPDEGPYARADNVKACGSEDGRLAVVVVKKAFCDLYNGSGERLSGSGHVSLY
jgi:hypothetical protein